MVVAIIVIVAVAAVVVIVLYVARRPRQDAKIVGFRKHIDALSPEARREVIDRVQNARDSGKGK